MALYVTTRFCQFEDAYKHGLLAAIKAKPHEYALADHQTAEEYAELTADKMLFAIATRGIKSVNAKSAGFRNACKALGIKFTYESMETFLKGVQS